MTTRADHDLWKTFPDGRQLHHALVIDRWRHLLIALVLAAAVGGLWALAWSMR